MRRTGLRTYTTLKPGKPLQRRTPLAEIGKRATKAGKKPRRPDTGPDRSTRELVLERDDYTCVSCGKPILGQQYSLQHRRARGSGGTSDPRINHPSNLIVLCGSATSPGCHLVAEQRSAEALDLGYVVSLNSSDRPIDVPVHHAAHGLVYLDDEGGWSPVAEFGGAA